MKKKIVSVLLCVAMVATMAVGCGGKKTDGDSVTDSVKDFSQHWMQSRTLTYLTKMLTV